MDKSIFSAKSAAIIFVGVFMISCDISDRLYLINNSSEAVYATLYFEINGDTISLDTEYVYPGDTIFYIRLSKWCKLLRDSEDRNNRPKIYIFKSDYYDREYLFSIQDQNDSIILPARIECFEPLFFSYDPKK
jgi:hypothetical protein